MKTITECTTMVSLTEEESLEKKRCPRCRSQLVIHDTESGDIVCGSCGYVIMERTERPGREWRSLVGEESRGRERVGAPLSPRRPDLGMATEIGPMKGAEKLRFWQKRTLYTPKQKSLRRGLRLVDILSSKLNLGNAATDQAAHIFRRAVKAKFLRGRSIKSVAATAVYSSCREHGIPRSLDLVAQVASVDRKVLSRQYRSLLMLFAIKVPQVEPAQYVPIFTSELEIDERIARKAYALLGRASRNGLSAGMDPRGLAAGALYVAGLAEEGHAVQKKLAKAAGVSAFTLRKRAHLLRKYLVEEEELQIPIPHKARSP